MTDASTYPEPPASGNEIDTLVGSLERQRATFAWKCADLDETGLRTRIDTSMLTLGGLLKHLAYMEDINFTRDFAGQALPAPWAAAEGRPSDWIWRTAADNSPDQLQMWWREAVDRSRLVVRQALADRGPDTPSASPDGRSYVLRRLLVDFIEEYARHTGHADLLREAVDGRVGEDPPGRPYAYSASS